MIWHSTDKDAVCTELNVNYENGLYPDDIADRKKIYGENIISSKTKKTLWERLSEQFKATGVIILFVATLLSLATNLIFQKENLAQPIAMLLLTAIYALIGAIERHKANEMYERLQSSAVTNATVKRGKSTSVVAATELVPGDIIFLSAGDYIPADARILDCKNFHCDESYLTGDRAPAEKQSDVVLDDITPLEDRINMVYSGCSVKSGEATAVVVSTGMNSEIGRIEAINEVDKTVSSSPLKARIISASAKIFVILLALCGVVFLIGLIGLIFNRESFSIRFISLVSSVATLFASLIPESLIAATSVIISISLKKAAAKKSIIKNLSTLESLGNISVICCDKTGNMTSNQNKVAYIYDGESICDYKENAEKLPPSAASVLSLAAICNDATLQFENGKPIASGQPAEAAIVTAMAESFKRGKEDLDSTCPRLSVLPFDKQRRLMTTINMIDGKIYAITKGAPEIIIDNCLSIDTEKAYKCLEGMATRGLRVIAVAYKLLDNVPLNPSPEEIENELIFSGLIAIDDPIYEDAKESVSLSKNAGIRTIMVTGDNLLTASSVATELGILYAGMRAVSSEDLAKMSDEELENKIDGISVFARITPEDKLRIVKALQAKGETVIITGDGVEDAKALRTADIGCALGEWGSDVAKNASDITLQDDKYSSIVEAIKLGKSAFYNIRKAATYILSTYLGLIISSLIIISVFGVIPLPNTALIWISMVVATIPAFAIGSESPEKSTMNTPPRNKKEFFFTKNVMIDIFWQSGVLGLVTAFGFILGKSMNGGNIEAGYTLCFIVLSLASALHSFNLRSASESIVKVGLIKNKEILASFVICILLLIIATLSPVSSLLGLATVSSNCWWVGILLAVIPVIVCEGVKLARKLITVIKEDK